MRTRDLVYSAISLVFALAALFASLNAVSGEQWPKAIWFLLITGWWFHEIDRTIDNAERRVRIQPRDFHINISGEAPERISYLADKRRDGGL